MGFGAGKSGSPGPSEAMLLSSTAILRSLPMTASGSSNSRSEIWTMDNHLTIWEGWVLFKRFLLLRAEFN